MNYIPGAEFDVPNDRFASLGLIAGRYHIQNIRFNRQANQITYTFTNGKQAVFNSVQDAEAIFDRIRGVVRSTTPLDTETTLEE